MAVQGLALRQVTKDAAVDEPHVPMLRIDMLGHLAESDVGVPRLIGVKVEPDQSEMNDIKLQL